MLHRLDVMRRCRWRPTRLPIDREPHPGAPTQPVRCSGHFLDRHRTIVTGQSPQLLGHQGGLQGPLGRHRHVLKVAATTTAGAGVGTRRCHPIGRRLQDFHRIGPEK